MATAGIDVGNATSCVALARKRGVDVIMNAESKRETPAVVSYGDKMRFVGVEGAARLTMNVKNSVVQVKRLIGRKFADPDVQKDIEDFVFKVTEGPDGGCLVNVTFLGEPRQFTPEQIMTSLLKDLKHIAESDQGSAITDCALSVPVYFTEAERLAMLNAATLAGLKCLRLMNEPTAIALNWGIFKSDLPEAAPLNVAFVDVGHSSLQVCIAAFKKGEMEVKAHSWDRSLGGRDLDNVLFAHFAGEFKAKHGLDVYGNAKARYRMKTQIEKCRQRLTINPQAPLDVECLMDDIDFRSEMTRDKFEELAAPVLERVRKPVMQALETAGMSAADVSTVEMCGAASRTPAMVKTVADVFGQEPKRTMNSKECVSRGCSLQAAMLSPLFQVRNFDVKDVYPFKVSIAWEKEDGPAQSQLFGASVKDGAPAPQHFPSVKSVAFHKTEPFTVTASYSDDSDVPEGVRQLSKFAVTEAHKAPEGATSVSTKLQFELDLHGLVRCTAASHHHKVEVVEQPAAAPAAADAEMADAPAAGEAAAPAAADDAKGENGDASKMDAEAAPAPAPAAAADADKPAPTRKLKKVSTPAKYEQQSLVSITPQRYQQFLEEEGQMSASDALETATAEAKNNLEEYLLGLRSHLGDRYEAFETAEAREALTRELTALEDWLYEEGEEEQKSVYDGKLAELHAKGDPIKLRYDEAGTRDGALQALSNACQHMLEWTRTEDPKYAHIEAKDREAVSAEATTALKWLEDTNKQQAALAKTDPPAVLTKDIEARKRALENVCKPVVNKPAPPPPKAEPKAEEAKPAEGEAAGAAAADGAAPEGEAAGGEEGATPMEQEGAETAAPAAAEGADKMDEP